MSFVYLLLNMALDADAVYLKVRLQQVLAQAIEENEECPVCFEVLREPRITVCAHSFCLACITEVIRRDTRCPMVRPFSSPSRPSFHSLIYSLSRTAVRSD